MARLLFPYRVTIRDRAVTKLEWRDIEDGNTVLEASLERRKARFLLVKKVPGQSDYTRVGVIEEISKLNKDLPEPALFHKLFTMSIASMIGIKALRLGRAVQYTLEGDVPAVAKS